MNILLEARGGFWGSNCDRIMVEGISRGNRIDVMGLILGMEGFFKIQWYLNMYKTNTFSKCSGLVKETQSERLQRSVEFITQTLEHEKREASYLDEQIKLLAFEMNSLKKPSSKANLQIQATISVLEKKLELEKNNLNTTKYKNRQLREKINEYRLDKSAHKQSLISVIDNLDKTTKEAGDREEEINKTTENDITQQEKIILIRSRSANQRYNYNDKISNLDSLLKNQEKGTKLNFEDRNNYFQSIEIITILKQMVRESQKLTFEKKRDIDHYVRHISTLVSGFEQIKKIMGISKIDDIVTSCIKSEEQSQEILLYLNTLTSEIDLLEETLRLNNAKIEMLAGSRSVGEANISEFLKKNETTYNSLKEKMIEKQQKLDELAECMKDLLPIVKRLYELLASMNFTSDFTSVSDVSSIHKLNQENSNLLLGQIEEFINLLLVSTSLKTQDSLIIHYPDIKNPRSASNHRTEIRDLLHEKDLYDEPDYEEVKMPISLQEMKLKALTIFERRRSLIKDKSLNLERETAKTPNYRATKEFL